MLLIGLLAVGVAVGKVCCVVDLFKFGSSMVNLSSHINT